MNLRRLQLFPFVLVQFCCFFLELKADNVAPKEIRWVFEDWAVTHDKYYDGIREREHRFSVFKKNLDFVEEHNRMGENHTYVLDLNHFADLTSEEFRSIYLRSSFNMTEQEYLYDTSSNQYEVLDGEALPESVDWRSKGAVSSVKHQGRCGQ